MRKDIRTPVIQVPARSGRPHQLAEAHAEGACAERTWKVSHPSTVRFRRDLARLLPARPFALHFWDGTDVPATRPPGAVLTIHSPSALAYALHAPGQLGLGRAYVAGAIDVDDLDALVSVA